MLRSLDLNQCCDLNTGNQTFRFLQEIAAAIVAVGDGLVLNLIVFTDEL